MNKILKIFLICIFIISAVFIFQKNFIDEYKNDKIVSTDKNLASTLKFKGLQGAVDFVLDEEGNYYIAFKNSIQIIKVNGKSYELFKSSNINIDSLCYSDKKLYYSSETKIFCFDLTAGKNSEIMNDLPNLGDYKESILRVKGDYLYITIGAASNSGVIGEDNIWLSNLPYFHDISPNSITLKGINFGQENTGAFQSPKTKSIKGQMISGHFPGNASVIIYNTKSRESETFAWGIRNIKGMDFTSEGKLIATVGGMENRGLRPIIGDSDYIYEIKKGTWYGWPDYSGGDPVNSPKFKGKNNSEVKLILENHPTTNPPAPIYQSKAVSELGAVAVDPEGVIGEKNVIYFYDSGNNKIYSLDKKSILKEKFILPSNFSGCIMKFYKNKFFILDNSSGNLFSIENSSNSQNLSFNEKISLYLLITIIFGIIIVLKVQRE